jgi:hypothetical protein
MNCLEMRFTYFSIALSGMRFGRSERGCTGSFWSSSMMIELDESSRMSFGALPASDGKRRC